MQRIQHRDACKVGRGTFPGPRAGLRLKGAVFSLWLALAWCPTAPAEPYIPGSDSEVLERLPANVHARTRELRRLRQALAHDAANLELAVALARGYLDIGQAEADPRYYGYAQAALQPWWNLAAPTPEVLLVRATVHQHRHDFDAALSDLSQVLRVRPRNSAAWLAQAVILQVRGEFAGALRSCFALLTLSDALLSAACIASVTGLSGRAEESYRLLHRTLQESSSGSLRTRLWAWTVLAEMAVGLGDAKNAEQHFEQALALRQRSVYLLSAYADFLLDQNRPDEVLTLLAADTGPDALLLRLALAERAMGTPRLQDRIASLRARFAAAAQRGDGVHLGDEARFALHLLNAPARALRLAKKSWTVERVPGNARLVLEAALAAGRPGAGAPVLDWLAETGLEDVRLAALARRLAEAGP